jgi:hypothetical protein
MQAQNGTQEGPRSARPSRVKVTFSLNVPQIFTLDGEPPQDVTPGNWGDQYRYFLAEGRIAFVEPVVHEKLMQLGAAAGETFMVTKGSKGAWEVKRPFAAVEREAPQVSRPRTAPPPIRQGNEEKAAVYNCMAEAISQAMEAVKLSGFEEATREDIRALAITIYISTTGGRK